MKEIYTIKQIRSSCGNIIEESMKTGMFKNEGEVVTYISVIISCGVNIEDYNTILFLLEKIVETKNNKDNNIDDDDYCLSKMDNQTLVYILLKKYFSDDNKEYKIRVLKTK